MQHPVDLYRKYLEICDSSLLRDEDFYCTFEFQEGEEYQFVGVTLSCDHPSETCDIDSSIQKHQYMFEHFKQFDPKDFSWTLYYVEVIEDNFMTDMDLSQTYSGLEYDDQTLISILERLETVYVIAKANKEIEKRHPVVLILNIPYDLRKVQFYEDIDANSVPLYFCSLDLWIEFEQNGKECEILVEAGTLEELLSDSRKKREELDMYFDQLEKEGK